MCKECDIKPVYITLNHNKLCKNCFIRYFEKKVLRTIRTYQLIEDNDKIGVGVSGGKDSLSCLYILNNLLKKRGQEPIAILIDEGIEGYRNKTLEDAKKFCEENKIKLKVVSLFKEFGFTLDKYLMLTKKNSCTVCGIFRRYLLNKTARELKVTKLATGHNLDDEAQTILMNQVKGNVGFSAKLGPKTGVLMHKKFVRRIKPLYFMTEKEVTIYAFLRKLPVTYIECPYFLNTLRGKVGELLNSLEDKFPGTKQGIINSFLETLPKLKELYQNQEIGTCKECKEPATKELCRACELLKEVS